MKEHQRKTVTTLPLISRNHFWLFMITVLMAGSISVTGCKSKKPIVDTTPKPVDTSAEDARLARAKAALEDLLNSPQSRTFAELEDKEKRLGDIIAMNLNDSEVDALIDKVRTKLDKERAFLEAEEARRKERAMYSKLAETFEGIAKAGSVNVANTRINQALNMFASDDILVLIVVSEENGKKDYDRPTNIKNYLNYLKDQKQSKNAIGNIIYDASGKIKELELVKNN